MKLHAARYALAFAVLAAPSGALAESGDATAQADALFRSAKSLRAAGKYPEACAAFAESKRLASGIGVSLYLADCYERVGKTASAWTEFRDAEKRARGRNDKRADVAHARAAALEPRLGHIGVANPVGPTTGADVTIDGGEPLPVATWATAAVDAGNHEVTLRLAGRVAVRAVAHVEPGRWAIVRFDDPQVTLSSGLAAPAASTSGGVGTNGGDKVDTRRVAGYSLLAAGVVGIVAGAGLLALKNQSLSTGAPDGAPTVDQGAAIGSDVAFALGGAALVSAVILYLTAPTPKDTAFTFAPAPLVGGAGAILTAHF
ncbi:MAG: tetratricopeptide repeat protein [Polyangiaceae bacterium]